MGKENCYSNDSSSRRFSNNGKKFGSLKELVLSGLYKSPKNFGKTKTDFSKAKKEDKTVKKLKEENKKLKKKNKKLKMKNEKLAKECKKLKKLLKSLEKKRHTSESPKWWQKSLVASIPELFKLVRTFFDRKKASFA